MCGIIGYVGQKECSGFLVDALKRLEYRGYDSSGVAAQNKDHFEIIKDEGKLENIERVLKKTPLHGKTGIGHTRWATHGKPNAINAHPHRAGKTVLVHNGIIENYEALRDELTDKGFKMVSETDSELFGHLVEDFMAKGTMFEEAVRQAFLRLHGSCSIVVVHDDHPDKVIAIRNGTPLVVAHSTKAQGCFVASDAQAILEHTNAITYLENEDLVLCTQEGFQIFSIHQPLVASHQIRRPVTMIDWSPTSMDKAGFPHYMLKEIYEQPRAILDTLDNLIDRETAIPRLEPIGEMLKRASRLQLIGCGTAWHAALVGKYILEKHIRLPIEVDLASEYRYRDPVVDSNVLVLVVSQSGETADTLAALREAKRRGAMTAAICNVRNSSITREADATLFTAAGPEIGVASTKAFTTQLLVFMMLAQYAEVLLGKNAPLFKNTNGQIDLKFFLKLPHQIQESLGLDKEMHAIAKQCVDSKGFLFIARGRLFPIALEGALKTKEITYIHAEGYPAGELKHGPIAMVEAGMTVVVIAPRDNLYEKTVSNLQEVKARGATIFSVGNKNDAQLKKMSDHFIGYDFASDWSDPITAVVPLQFLAYHMAVLRGTDVDRPRNLAKSVTVE